ncbi:MAG: bifunctional DNA-formamidopyrimidine glycosylase/DNA-(apurinic or apyrimidinic site) lyase, partial [Peptococcaceae bacterium]|nr:bifunctional DNA-formamidopyrimidine glycosylase/DNA-(apurinic or apyrimidinic site) lyase [Peptococcaceae bacterium]
VSRRGKFILIALEGNLLLAVHLRMTGKVIYTRPGTPVDKHTHVLIGLDNHFQLQYSDIRKFGRMALIPSGETKLWPGLDSLGVEPLSSGFTGEFLEEKLSLRKTKIKPLLLDQTLVAGLGNIYVDEALHRAKINPQRPASDLSFQEVAELHSSIRRVLEEAIANRGTSFRDYVDSRGDPGANQMNLRVYGRESKPCVNCQKPVSRIKLAGRSTFFCEKCQV